MTQFSSFFAHKIYPHTVTSRSVIDSKTVHKHIREGIWDSCAHAHARKFQPRVALQEAAQALTQIIVPSNEEGKLHDVPPTLDAT
jgi:hypothetical protein